MPQGPDLNQLLKQAQQMQAEMAKAQEQLKNETVEASAGGGMVKVTMTGDMQLREIKISPKQSTLRIRTSSRTWSRPRSTRRCAPHRSSPPIAWAASPAGAYRASPACRSGGGPAAAAEQDEVRPARLMVTLEPCTRDRSAA